MQSLSFDIYGDLIGKKWVRKARGPNEYDCYGLVMEMYRRFGVIIPDQPYIDELLNNEDLINNDIKSNWIKCDCIPRSVILFQYNTIPSHMGVMIDNDRFIHASGNYNTTLVSKLTDRLMPWKKNTLGFFVHKELKI